MPVRKVTRMGHPVLRQVGEIIPLEHIQSEEIQQLIQDLKDTMKHENGLGIAAPQIGVSKQICILEIPNYNQRFGQLIPYPLSVIINPVITVLDEATQGFWEGCLSIPGIRGYVLRPKKIKVVYLNERGESIEVIAEGLAAVVFQHEIDHLFGNLYIDKVVSKKIAFIEEFDQFGIQSSEKVLDD